MSKIQLHRSQACGNVLLRDLQYYYENQLWTIFLYQSIGKTYREIRQLLSENYRNNDVLRLHQPFPGADAVSITTADEKAL